ncbi:MAG: HEPN domain-containing protein [Betaproteobacteria bacterium]|nr:HEPN domain-containing protein [Betaproteobacteria bacterium]
MDRAEIAQLVAGEVQAAHGSLAAAMNNLSGPHGAQYRSCVKELYFACFHMATALLASKGIHARRHDAVQELLALHFVKPAALAADTTRRFGALMDRRHTADYKTFVQVDASDLEEFRPWVSQFLAAALVLLGKSAPERESAQYSSSSARRCRRRRRPNFVQPLPPSSD